MLFNNHISQQIQSGAEHAPVRPHEAGGQGGGADPQHGGVRGVTVGGLDGGGRGGAAVSGPPALLPPILSTGSSPHYPTIIIIANEAW